jgi:hypothetical protein
LSGQILPDSRTPPSHHRESCLFPIFVLQADCHLLPATVQITHPRLECGMRSFFALCRCDLFSFHFTPKELNANGLPSLLALSRPPSVRSSRREFSGFNPPPRRWLMRNYDSFDMCIPISNHSWFVRRDNRFTSPVALCFYTRHQLPSFLSQSRAQLLCIHRLTLPT